MADTNQVIAEKAAEAVNPSSPAQAGLLGVLRGKSPADAMQDQRTHAQARRDPIADPVAEDQFGANFEKALAAKQSANGEPQQAPQSEAAPAQSPPPEKPSPLAPPKIGKHGHIRQLKEGMAAKEQGWEQERATLLKELETLKAPKQTDPKIADIIKENEALRRDMTLMDITRSPEFQSKFEQPRKVTILQAKNIAGDKGAEVETILSMPAGLLRDQKLDELISELPASTAAIVKAANSKLAEIDFGKQVEIETAKLGLEDHLRNREKQQLIQKQRQDSEFNELLSDWSRQVDALNPEKNKGASDVVGRAKAIFDGQMDVKERAAAALNSALMPVLLEEHSKAIAEVERLAAALARYEEGMPGGSSGSDDTDSPRVPQSQADRMAAFERGLDEKMRRDPTWSQQRRGRLY